MSYFKKKIPIDLVETLEVGECSAFLSQIDLSLLQNIYDLSYDAMEGLVVLAHKYKLSILLQHRL